MDTALTALLVILGFLAYIVLLGLAMSLGQWLQNKHDEKVMSTMTEEEKRRYAEYQHQRFMRYIDKRDTSL